MFIITAGGAFFQYVNQNQTKQNFTKSKKSAALFKFKQKNIQSTMVISHKYKFIYFCPVGNCATSSIQAALEPYHDDAKQYDDNNGTKHICPRDFFNKSNQELKKYFKFAVVRNPWDWVLAIFSKNLTYIKRTGILADGSPDWENTEIIKGETRQAMYVYDNCARGWAVEATSFAKQHFPSQYAAHCDDSECLVDNFLRFENLKTEFADTLKNLGLPDLKLPHKQNNNNQAQKKYQTWYGEKEKQIIYDHFKVDIDIFKYEF